MVQILTLASRLQRVKRPIPIMHYMFNYLHMSHKLLITHNSRQNLDDSEQIELKWNTNVD